MLVFAVTWVDNLVLADLENGFSVGTLTHPEPEPEHKPHLILTSPA